MGDDNLQNKTVFFLLYIENYKWCPKKNFEEHMFIFCSENIEYQYREYILFSVQRIYYQYREYLCIREEAVLTLSVAFAIFYFAQVYGYLTTITMITVVTFIGRTPVKGFTFFGLVSVQPQPPPSTVSLSSLSVSYPH